MKTRYENPQISEGRAAAMDILKPTEAQLQHGLDLHADALVIDAYGFSAVAAVDGAALARLAERGADAGRIRRCASEMTMTRMADDATQYADFAEAWDASGVTCVLRNSGEEGNDIARLLERLAWNTYVTDRLPQLMMRAVEPDHIKQAKQTGRRCFYLTTNGVPLPGHYHNTMQELGHIRIFAQLGVRMMHLTYNRRNAIGDGCVEKNDGGLSDFGVAVVREMNRAGVIVDGAHSSQLTCLDMAASSHAPVVVSHSTCMELNAHCRAKCDEVIRAVAQTDGYVGICGIPAFLGGSGDIAAWLDHIDYAVRLVGARHVAIGTDTAMHARDCAAEHAMAPSLPPDSSRWEDFWHPDDPIYMPRWHAPHMSRSTAWTNFPLLTVGLVQRGYCDDDIRAIVGGNVLRVAEAVWQRRGSV